ncbi:MAG: hypothetical protein IKM43_03935 [Clostridia bacterium]|nr:hypothetical protein [Clostridia bacterium]
MKKHNVLNLLKFVELLINARIAYNNVKNDEEAKKTADMFGKRSLVYFFVFLGLSVLAVGIIYWSVTHFVSTLIFVAIIGFVVAVYLAVYALGMFILSFNLAIKQKRLNNKPVGIIALVLNILVLVAVLVGIIALIIVLKTL